MTYEHFRATVAYESAQGLSDTIRLKNDDVQDFDVIWDQALLSTNEPLTDSVGRIVSVKNYRVLFSCRLCWLCMIKKLYETMDRRVIQD